MQKTLPVDNSNNTVHFAPQEYVSKGKDGGHVQKFKVLQFKSS